MSGAADQETTMTNIDDYYESAGTRGYEGILTVDEATRLKIYFEFHPGDCAHPPKLADAATLSVLVSRNGGEWEEDEQFIDGIYDWLTCDLELIFGELREAVRY